MWARLNCCSVVSVVLLEPSLLSEGEVDVNCLKAQSGCSGWASPWPELPLSVNCLGASHKWTDLDPKGLPVAVPGITRVILTFRGGLSGAGLSWEQWGP